MHLKADWQKRIDFNDEAPLETELGESYNWRVLFFYFVLIFIFLFLAFFVFNLTIVKGTDYYLQATKSVVSTDPLAAPRGLIYDANGTKLAYNVPGYSLYVNPNEITATAEASEIAKVAGMIGLDSDTLLQSYKNKVYATDGTRSKDTRVTISNDLTSDQYLGLLANLDKFPGVYVDAEAVRKYDFGNITANFIGYTGDATQNDVKQRGIDPKDRVGRSGLENEYDTLLRGKDGVVGQEKDVLSGNQTSYDVQPAQSGDNLYLTIDMQWQQKLASIMQTEVVKIHSGASASAGVVINSRTGAVKAMVTLPNYDNNLFANGISAADYNAYINDPRRPLINRPIGLQLPPGSTWKIIGANAALESGAITPDTTYFSNRCMDLPGGIKLCEADHSYLGVVDFKTAMAASSNIYFCNAAIATHNKTGSYDYLYNVAKDFGIGQATGIDLPGETAGTLPSPELKKRLLGQPWYIGDECNTMIGQGLDTVTPLQMTVVASAIEQNGKIIQPYILDHAQTQDGQITYQATPTVKHTVNISQKTLDIVKSGMRYTATNGTAAPLREVPGNVIAKTGSSDASEVINGVSYSGAHSWVVGCFDYGGENYCFTVMQEFAGRGYKTVPIMKKLINCIYTNFANKCDSV